MVNEVGHQPLERAEVRSVRMRRPADYARLTGADLTCGGGVDQDRENDGHAMGSFFVEGRPQHHEPPGTRSSLGVQLEPIHIDEEGEPGAQPFVEVVG